MNKKYRVSLYLLLFTTLFLFAVSAPCFALTATELLNSDVNFIQYDSEDKRDDGTALYSYQVIEINSSNYDTMFDQTKRALKFDDDWYGAYKVYYYDVDGKERKADYTLGYNDDDKKIILRLNQKLPEGTSYHLSIEQMQIKEDNPDGIENAPTETIDGPNKTISITKVEKENPKRTIFFSAAWDALWGDYSTIGKMLVETFCDILIPLGDALLDMVCNAIGEVVTIDRVVYNNVRKIDIDFFDNSSSSSTAIGRKEPIKVTMSGVVNSVFVFFRKIVIIIYMIMLVYIGIKMILTSTPEKRASGKSLLMSWILGISMLFLFPYVMKYAIKVNGALCTMIGESYTTSVKNVDKLQPSLYRNT